MPPTDLPRLGTPPPTDLVDARLQVHWAAQAVSAVGRTWLPHRADDGHTNFGWDARLGALVGRAVGDRSRFRAALQPAELAVLLVDEEGYVRDRLALAGRTLDDAYAWLATAVAVATGEERPLDRPGYEMPAHPVGEGRAFAASDAEAFAEVGRWFAHADAVALPAAAALLDGAEVRVWPHHFDLGALAFFAPDPASAEAPQVGFGLTPGDESIAEPYWYVNAYPVAGDRIRPPLPEGGSWEEEAFSGALLRGSAVVAAGGARAQADRSSRFVVAALTACRGLVGRPAGGPR